MEEEAGIVKKCLCQCPIGDRQRHFLWQIQKWRTARFQARCQKRCVRSHASDLASCYKLVYEQLRTILARLAVRNYAFDASREEHRAMPAYEEPPVLPGGSFLIGVRGQILYYPTGFCQYARASCLRVKRPSCHAFQYRALHYFVRTFL